MNFPYRQFRNSGPNGYASYSFHAKANRKIPVS